MSGGRFVSTLFICFVLFLLGGGGGEGAFGAKTKLVGLYNKSSLKH